MTDWLPYLEADDTEHLSIRLEEGEHVCQDFKQTFNDPHKIARSAVAFANQKGGSLFAGVDDKGQVTGTLARSEYYHLADILEHYCRPVPEAECLVHHIEGKEVLEVYIFEGQEKPYASRDKHGVWQIYLRVEDTCKKIGSVG